MAFFGYHAGDEVYMVARGVLELLAVCFFFRTNGTVHVYTTGPITRKLSTRKSGCEFIKI